ncbi:MAG: dethiobiotin synthase [Opitutales bacterium]
MKTIFITGSDTGIGKTWVSAALTRLLPRKGETVQLVKPVETGVKGDVLGDAAEAALATPPGVFLNTYTFFRFSAPLAPISAAREEGSVLDTATLVSRTRNLPICDWRIVEGAGGIAVPLDSSGADWADFARQIGADFVVLVVPDRLGAVNQCRLTLEFARSRNLPVIVWLNECQRQTSAVRSSNREALENLALPHLCIQNYAEPLPENAQACRAHLRGSAERSARPLLKRIETTLEKRTTEATFRELRCHAPLAEVLNLADNDYLDLARDATVVDAGRRAVDKWGCSSSASPLITGYGEAHRDLESKLCAWHGFPYGLVWNSGYTANQALLGHLPEKGDLVLADRLIHNSMISGILRSGGRLLRYQHNDIDQLQTLLEKEERKGNERTVFVVTESVFSMDGDSPDLRAMATLRERFGFVWVVDEAHATGWYGPTGGGLVEEHALNESVDILVGTMGKALGSLGAFTLFRRNSLRDYLINTAGEFIYSTYLPAVCAAAASAAIDRCRELSSDQPRWREGSRLLRRNLSRFGWPVPDGDSPIVPVRIGDAAATADCARRLRENNILVGAVRPPTVPAGSSRLRLSLKRSLTTGHLERLVELMDPERHPSMKTGGPDP